MVTVKPYYAVQQFQMNFVPKNDRFQNIQNKTNIFISQMITAQ